MNDENPNWRMSVGIKGTAGDVPRDNTTIEKKNVRSFTHCSCIWSSPYQRWRKSNAPSSATFPYPLWTSFCWDGGGLSSIRPLCVHTHAIKQNHDLRYFYTELIFTIQRKRNTVHACTPTTNIIPKIKQMSGVSLSRCLFHCIFTPESIGLQMLIRQVYLLSSLNFPH